MVNIFKDKKFLKECAIILIVGIIINAACFLMPLVVHAENLYYPVESGVNAPLGAFTEQEILEMCNNYSAFPSDYYYVIRVTASPNNVYPLNARYDVIVFDKSLYNTEHLGTFPIYIEVGNNGYFQFHLNPLYNNDNYNVKMYYMQSYSGTTSDLQLRGGAINNLSAYSPLVDDKTTYYFNISIPKDYVTNTEYVLKYTESINIGDFADLPDLDFILDNLQNNWEPPSSTTGHALPSAPIENPNNTPFQDRLQMFEYLKDSINAIVGNLGYNVNNWISNLMVKMVEGFNSVSQNVYNGFATLMQNIKDYFGPKLDKIIEVLEAIRDKTGYLTEDFDAEEVADYYEENCSLFELSSTVQSFFSSVSTTFSNVTPPQRLVFNIDFSNGPWPFSTVGIVSFNFDWYENIRNTIVPWILTFLYFGAVFSLGMQLPNIVHGMSGLFSPTLTGTQSISYMDTDGAYSSYNKVNTDHYSMFGGSMHFTKQHAYSSVSYKNKYGLPSVRK